MDNTIKDDIRKILLLHENQEVGLADYIEAKLKEERTKAAYFTFAFMIIVGGLIYILSIC